MIEIKEIELIVSSPCYKLLQANSGKKYQVVRKEAFSIVNSTAGTAFAVGEARPPIYDKFLTPFAWIVEYLALQSIDSPSETYVATVNRNWAEAMKLLKLNAIGKPAGKKGSVGEIEGAVAL